MTKAGEIEGLAARFFDAIEAGEVDAAVGCYAPHAVVWHNTDLTETSVGDNRRVLAGMVRATTQRRYEERRLIVHAGGFVQQHVLRARFADGRTLDLPACLLCVVEDGRITRLDEYFDSAPLAVFAPRGPP